MSTSPRCETLLTIVHAAVVSRFAAEATQRPRTRSVMPTSCGRLLRPSLAAAALRLIDAHGPLRLLCGHPRGRLSGQERRSLARRWGRF